MSRNLKIAVCAVLVSGAVLDLFSPFIREAINYVLSSPALAVGEKHRNIFIVVDFAILLATLWWAITSRISLELSRFFSYASLFCVLIVLISTFFPFIGGKAYFFRIAVELGVAFALLWWAFEAPPGETARIVREAFRKPLVIAVSAFVGVFLLASLFADNPHGAFWSNYERGEGGFQMFHYYAFFLLLVLFFRERREWERLFKVAAAAAFLMVLYGIFSAVLVKCPEDGVVRTPTATVDRCVPNRHFNPWQLVSVYVNPQGEPVAPTLLDRLTYPKVRFQGSLGNPAYVAPYLMFVIFYCCYLFSRRAKSWWWLVGGAFFFVILILTQTRGAFLGFAAAVIAFFLYAIAYTEGESRRRYTIFLWATALLYGALLYYRTSDAIARNAPVLERILDIGLAPDQVLKVWLVGAVVLGLLNVFIAARQRVRVFVAALFLALAIGGGWYMRSVQQVHAIDSFATRVWTWGSALKGFKERPLLGWGPENFPAVFDKHFDPRHFVPGQSTETWFDRAHSVFFDYLTEIGLIGLLAYLGMFAAFFIQFFRNVRAGAESVLAGALVVALPVGYLVQGAVLFDVLPIYMSLFLFLAFANWWLALPPHHHHHA